MGKHSLFRRAAALATAVLGLAAFTPAVQAAPTGPISFHAPDGLIVSTGNVYFTSHDAFSGVVWRTGQDSIAGQELPIYREIGARFGDIVFAQVDGVWWGYFFSAKAGVVSIKRVPLTGEAPAIDLKTGLRDIDIVNSHRNLVTDGAFLYWQDVNSVHRMPIRGGADVVLDRAAPNTPTAGLALRNGFLIYASVADIRYVATNGSSITNPQFRTLATGASRVTTLYTVSNGVYWGEQSGAVRLKIGSVTTTLPSTAGLVPTSLSTNGFTAGAAQAWSACAAQSCRLVFDFPISTFSMPVAAAAMGVTVTSNGSVIWGDLGGVHRQSF